MGVEKDKEKSLKIESYSTSSLSGYTVIIPTHNRATLLGIALTSIQRMLQPVGVDVEILVIDNLSTDNTEEVANASKGPYPVRVIREETLGLNHARNRGLFESRKDFLIYLDDDIEVHPNWLMCAHRALCDNSVGALCGPVDPRFEQTPPKWMTRVLIDSVTSGYSKMGSKTHVIERKKSHKLPGCNFGVWRELALKVGGFHPGLDRSGAGMLAGGDWEFGRRVVGSGANVLYVPGCRVTHLISRRKVSFVGLAKRWHGLGRTDRALQRIRGRKRLFRETLGRVLFILQSTYFIPYHVVIGDRGTAIERLMVALRTYGYLSFRDKIIDVVEKHRQKLEENNRDESDRSADGRI